MTTMRFVMTSGLVAALFTVSACGDNARKNQTAFDGKYYGFKLNRDKQDKLAFGVDVRDVSQGVSGAAETARLAATRFCIRHTGSSEVVWNTSPDDIKKLDRIAGDSISLSGRCADER